MCPINKHKIPKKVPDYPNKDAWKLNAYAKLILGMFPNNPKKRNLEILKSMTIVRHLFWDRQAAF